MPYSIPEICDHVASWLHPSPRTLAALAALFLLILPVGASSQQGPDRLSLIQAPQAVWFIRNMQPGEPFDSTKGHYSGTAFAWGPRDLITSFHVLLGVSRNGRSLDSIVISQGEKTLTVERVAVNVAHDLAYIRTREPTNAISP